MSNLQEIYKREIENTQNSIKYFDTHIDFLSDLKNTKPELEVAFEEGSFDELIERDKQSKNMFLKELERLQTKISELEFKV